MSLSHRRWLGLALVCACKPPHALTPAPVAHVELPPVALVAHTTLDVGNDCTLHAIDAERNLACLGRVWGAVRIFHPAIYDGVDWDAPLVDVVGRVQSATTEAQVAGAFGDMLRALGDPLTCVEDTRADAATTSIESRAGVTLVRIAPADEADVARTVARVRESIVDARPIVVDVRASGPTRARLTASALEALASVLVSAPTTSAAIEWIQHDGWAPQFGTTSGGYRTTFERAPRTTYEPARGPHPARVAFVVNESGVPPLAAAMRHAGSAFIVEQGHAPSTIAAWSAGFDLGEHHVVHVARARYVDPTGIDARGDVAEALRLVRGELATIETRFEPSRFLLTHDAHAANDVYETEASPTPAHRMLSLYRLWNVIHFFYPYQPLLDSPWDPLLAAYTGPFLRASTRLDYDLVIHELSAHIDDTHVWVQGDDAFQRSLGKSLSVVIERVEGLPVISSVDPPATDLHVGDVILAMDGEPFDARSNRFAKLQAASNDAARIARDDLLALRCGLDKTEVDVRIRDRNDHERELSVKCGRTAWAHHTGSVVTTLEKGIAYVDLTRLEKDDVDAMFAAVANSRAIIFDMRGYPHQTAWPIAPRLSHRDSPVSARFSRMVVSVESSRHELDGKIPAPDGHPVYDGVTVMLINHHTISQAEHTGLFFEAANGTRFIGSPSAGANGDITNVCLPGNRCVYFTGHDVRHADGRQLQRVGLQPDVLVRPTLRGVRLGKDEVLERALEYLRAAGTP